ncbi:transposase, MuDR, MULE transposase domain protein [Tanacetum coccineum]|uniref:Transposase, MuDR, MULE transposase domain protein n=1 Tax=Tanacetum coccineum TaxID=301880 RepID=A0ABQ4ZEN9_9ASTR
MTSLKFKGFLVYEELEYRVLVTNDVNYSNLVRYVKKKFKLADGNRICLSYNIGSNHINIIDDDDVYYFVNEVSGEEVKKLYIKLGEPTIQIKSFLCYMRPLIIIDGAHLKGTYLGTNLVAVGMDGNNQIIPIATGVSQGETGESWTWFLRKLKDCIGEVPNLAIISDRHYAITLACNTVFPNSFHGYCCRHLMMNYGMQSDKFKELYWKTCKAYTPEDFEKLMSDIHALRPDAHQKLVDAGIEKWSRAKCPANRYNYMTSNSVESINALTKDNVVRKKLNSTQQEESSQGKNYWSESQQEMYEPQHVTNYTEDMYHPHQEYTDQYFMYQHNPQSANLPINGLS